MSMMISISIPMDLYGQQYNRNHPQRNAMRNAVYWRGTTKKRNSNFRVGEQNL